MKTNVLLPYKRVQLSVRDEEICAERLAYFVRNNRIAHKIPFARIAKASGQPQSWFRLKPHLHKALPHFDQLKKIAVAAKLQIRLVFGAPHIAGYHSIPIKYGAAYHSEVIYRIRTEGEVLMNYANENQLRASIASVIRKVMQQKAQPGWRKRFEEFVEGLDKKVSKVWFRNIEQMCDELDLTIIVVF